MGMRRDERSHQVRKTLILDGGAVVIQGPKRPAAVWDVEHQQFQQIRHLAFNVKPSVASKHALPQVKQTAGGVCCVAQGALCSVTPWRRGEVGGDTRVLRAGSHGRTEEPSHHCEAMILQLQLNKFPFCLTHRVKLRPSFKLGSSLLSAVVIS